MQSVKRHYMKHIILFVMFNVALGIGAYAQTGSSSIDALKSFKLLPSEVPKGFVLRPIDKEAKEIGFTANPGTVTSSFFIKRLYPTIDTKSVSSLRLAIYVKRNLHQELGVNVIEYNSIPILNAETKKLRAVNGSRYFKRDSYIVVVWSDADAFQQQVAAIAAKIKSRLNLQEFKPVADNDSVVTDVTNAN
jgi:hypothetical protein